MTGARRLKDQRRIPLSMRLTPEIRERLVAEAAANGRSITQEAEFRIEQSFRDDRLEAGIQQILALIKPVRRVA